MASPPQNADGGVNSMPDPSWWAGATSSFQKLERLIQPRWMIDAQTRAPESGRALEEREMGMIREGSLPWVVVLPEGKFEMGLTARDERLEVLVLGTMPFSRFVDLFWEGVGWERERERERQTQVSEQVVEEAGEKGMDGVEQGVGVLPDAGERRCEPKVEVHEVRTHADPKIRMSVGEYEFEMRFLECSALVRRFPTASLILNAPSSSLEDQNNGLDENARQVVKDLRRDAIHMDEDHRRAYHYVRAWGNAKGLFNTKPKGFNSQDFVRICRPKPGDNITSVYDIIAHFFRQADLDVDIPENPCTEDWERFLVAAQNEPFYKNMEDFPYFIQVAMVYSGSSKVKGGDWLSYMDQRVVVLKQRLVARITKPTIQIWPQRLVKSEATPGDDMYEGCIMMGLRCSEADLRLANEVSDRWKVQVDEDTPLPDECFVFITINERDSVIRSEALKPCTRVWPRSILKDEDNRSMQETDLDESKKRKSVVKSSRKDPKSRAKQDKANDSKGVRLRPASEVLSRLRHDRTYNIDDCLVGYKDRHMNKLQEKPAADWITETTHEEFIPQHRIEYIRKGGEIVWDRQAKIDTVFKSGI